MFEFVRWVSFIVLIVFVFLISDFRNKGKTVPIVNRKITLTLRLIYFIPLCTLRCTVFCLFP